MPNPYSDKELKIIKERIVQIEGSRERPGVYEHQMRFLDTIKADRERIAEQNKEIESIELLMKRIEELETALDSLTWMVDTPEFQQTLKAVLGDNDWTTFSVFNPLGDETKCDAGWLDALIENIPIARAAREGGKVDREPDQARPEKTR